MYTPPREENQHPVCKARQLRNELGQAVNDKKWKRSHNLAQDLIKQIDLCLIHEAPHLDGVYRIGTMWFSRAPERAKDMIDRFNAKLRAAKEKLPK